MIYKKIAEKYKDLAGKWRVRVTLDDGSSIFLKFQKEPTEEEVKVETTKYISNEVLEKIRLATEIANKEIERQKLDLVRNVTIANLKTKLEAEISI